MLEAVLRNKQNSTFKRFYSFSVDKKDNELLWIYTFGASSFYGYLRV